MDHIDAAIYATVHDSDIKPKEIAARLGMSHAILLNKANPQCEQNKFSPYELIGLQKITGDYRIHEAMGLELGLQTINPESCSQERSVLEAMLSVCKESGDVASVIQSALEDGRFTDREKMRALKEIDEAVDSLASARKAVVEHV